MCEQPLEGEVIEIHHIKPKKEGGKDTIINLMPLHRICHTQITHGKVNYLDKKKF